MVSRPDLVFYADLHEDASKDHAKFMSDGGFAKLFEQNTTEVVKLKAQRAEPRASAVGGVAGGAGRQSGPRTQKRALIRTMSKELIRSSAASGISSLQDAAELSEIVEECVAIYECEDSGVPGELSFSVGDKITVHKRYPDGWCDGVHVATNTRGMFPAAYVALDVDIVVERPNSVRLRPGSWKKDSEFEGCQTCSRPYTLVHRRHHCRSCGGVFCSKCTKFRIDLPTRISKSKKSGKPKKNGRVCEPCFVKHGGVVMSKRQKKEHIATEKAIAQREALYAKTSSFAVAVFACESGGGGEISFRMGEKIEVLSKHVEGHDAGWWFGRVVSAEGEEPNEPGIFPSNHVEVVKDNALTETAETAKHGKKRFGLF